ncbi:MAG TPA: hypothetical protein VMR98_05885, partial [Candidatus Polarisedimenticolaceae bacterium]|nr:hypothetical protein [Candidatus Polarisedimenticolaceae bacterium]
MQTAAATIRHVRQQASPTRNEMIAGTQATSGALHLQRWNGTSWSSEWTVTVADGSLPRFDIAYEQTSGDALVVYTGNIVGGVGVTNELRYRTWNGASWSAEQNLDTLRTTGIVDAVDLESRPGSNDIGLAWGDRNFDLSANLWDGTNSVWKTEPAAALATDLTRMASATSLTHFSFDLSFESVSGELVVGWGTNGASDPTFRKRTAGAGGAWAGSSVAGAAATEEVTDMELTADPNSNFIGYSDVTDGIVTATAISPDLESGMWNGDTDTFGNVGGADATAGLALAAGTNNVSSGWVRSGTEDRYVVVYEDTTAGINYTYFNKNTSLWTAAPPDFTTAPSPLATKTMQRVRQNPNTQSELMLVTIDSASDLFTKKLTFDGTNLTWANAEPGGVSPETSVSSVTGYAADYAFNKFIPTSVLEQSAYRWFQSGSAFDSDGVIDGAVATEAITASVIVGSSIYIVGETDAQDWRIEKRDLTTGALVTAFDTDGIVDGAAATNLPNGVATDGTYLYVIGSDASANWRIEKRDLTTGALVTAFDT